MDNTKRALLPEGYIPKEDAAELISRHPRTLEKIWRQSQRSELKIRKRLFRREGGVAAEAAYHREDLLRYMKLRSSGGRSISQGADGCAIDLRVLESLIRQEADRVIAEIRKVRVHLEFGGGRDGSK